MAVTKCLDLADSNAMKDPRLLLNTARNYAWIIDEALTNEFLSELNDFRLTLSLDTKRPTVKRRFFSSNQLYPALREELQKAIQISIASSHVPLRSIRSESMEISNGIDNINKTRVHVLDYMRFLEYDQVGGRLDPHTDGNKVCDMTSLQSTHTMLLYLRDCQTGGETVLLDANKNVVEAVQPRCGRILLFPHPVWHEGAPAVDVPKLCLRAEICLY